MAFICKKFAMATVDHNGVHLITAPLRGCATSPSEGPLVATSANVGKGQGHDPLKAATRARGIYLNKIKETKAQNQL